MVVKELNTKELSALMRVVSEEGQDVVLVRFLPPGLVDRQMREEMQKRAEFLGFILQNNQRVIFSGLPEEAETFAGSIEEAVSLKELSKASEMAKRMPYPWERKVQASPKL